MIRSISLATFLLWVPLAVLAGHLLSQELWPLGIHGRSVLLELTVLISGVVSIVFAAFALARNTRMSAARAFIAAVPGAISATLLAWALLMRTTKLDPTPVGWLFLTDLLLTIMLPVAWFIVWRSCNREDNES